ncbi:MAG: DUF3471 domain-containing protein [Spirosomataceae bacterium]
MGTICNYVSDKLLNLSVIDWSSRLKTAQAESKAKLQKAKADNEAKRKANTKPSHPLEDYSGTYEHPAYGSFALEVRADYDFIGIFHGLPFSIKHYHYDIFEGSGIFDQMKFDFQIDPQGEIEGVVVDISNAGKIHFKKRDKN